VTILPFDTAVELNYFENIKVMCKGVTHIINNNNLSKLSCWTSQGNLLLVAICTQQEGDAALITIIARYSNNTTTTTDKNLSHLMDCTFVIPVSISLESLPPHKII
jgi:hypothetical protein